ncbi:hypothetical protein [Methanocaldococcus sp. FS406-22]|uniref:hypothetical protein n=1 Tax=Methanocaldococcus sp. (strain FS406-22) TaxID=644281 RepID=UPI00068D1640|nr:hypothetical protein [Methanocaldococcus sp. FS406-22]
MLLKLLNKNKKTKLNKIENKEGLSHKILRIKENKENNKNKNLDLENKLKELLGNDYGRIINQFDDESVLAEYRNLRLSMENNRTYIEASELFKKEMELIKEKSGIFEKIIFIFYKAISYYGESIFMPFFWIVYVIFVMPLIALDLNYMLGNFPKGYTYIDCLFDTLRAFFQLGIRDDNSPMYNYEWLIRIISLILLGNIFIAIKRRLERK